MPLNNRDHELPEARLAAFDSKLKDDSCPKCGAEMEPIEPGEEGPPVERLQLCPTCYLVTWSDREGMHVRQGVPVKPGGMSDVAPSWGLGEPRDC
jgi:uncharacterized protein with PIN domain